MHPERSLLWPEREKDCHQPVLCGYQLSEEETRMPQVQWKQLRKKFKTNPCFLQASDSTVLPEAVVEYRELSAGRTRQAYVS